MPIIVAIEECNGYCFVGVLCNVIYYIIFISK